MRIQITSWLSIFVLEIRQPWNSGKCTSDFSTLKPKFFRAGQRLTATKNVRALGHTSPAAQEFERC
jgi:hypothetical protein